MSMSVRLTNAATTIGSTPNAISSSIAGPTSR